MARIFEKTYPLAADPDPHVAVIPDADLAYVEIVQVDWHRETVVVTFLASDKT